MCSMLTFLFGVFQISLSFKIENAKVVGTLELLVFFNLVNSLRVALFRKTNRTEKFCFKVFTRQ